VSLHHQLQPGIGHFRLTLVTLPQICQF
jgi:hypothetical protein